MTKEDIKNKKTFELAQRLNEISIERNKLDMSIVELDKEYNAIVQELWDRIPSLKDDVNIQPKVKVKKK